MQIFEDADLIRRQASKFTSTGRTYFTPQPRPCLIFVGIHGLGSLRTSAMDDLSGKGLFSSDQPRNYIVVPWPPCNAGGSEDVGCRARGRSQRASKS